MKKKCLATGIILLFIGVAIAPSINFTVVKASNDNDLVEVTTQACGINGYGNTTVKLTREQYQNLEQYLIEFRARLNQTSTREEAVPIFKEAVVELNKYGLLPKGMNVEKAQRLVIGLYQNTKLLKCLDALSNKSEKSLLQEGNKNCLIYGEAQDNTIFQGPVSKAIYGVLFKLMNFFCNSFFYIGFLFFILCQIHNVVYIGSLNLLLNILRGLPYIGATIYYGKMSFAAVDPPIYYFPAEGTIWTNGVYGNKNWSGQFYGQLSSLEFVFLFDLYYPGASGFTGLRLYLSQTNFYFGFALNVNVGPNHP